MCNATGEWEKGWEEVFEKVAGPVAAKIRKRVATMSIAECTYNLEILMSRTGLWEAPDPLKICLAGLGSIDYNL